MNVIYTQELDNAITIASALHGIIVQGKNIKGSDIEGQRPMIRELATESGYIKTIYQGLETIVIWGTGLIQVLKPSEYGIPFNENEGFFPDEIKYKEKEGHEKEAQLLADILKSPENEIIYDASYQGGKARFAFPSLYTYAGVSASKIIYKVELNDFTPEGIRKAFERPLDADSTARRLTRELTHQKLYYIANTNLKYICPDQENYPRFRDLSLLADIVERNDRIAEEDAKSRYIVSLQGAYPETGEVVTLKSKKAEFLTIEDANKFIASLPGELPVKITTEEKWEKAPGLHSVSSLCEAAKKEYNYRPEQVRAALGRLAQKGYIKNPNSEKRTVPENAVDETFAIYKMLLKYKNIVPESLRKRGNNVKLEPDAVSTENKAGIMLTKNIMTDTGNDVDRSVYYLIIKGLLKLYMGRKKTEITRISVDANDITFSMTGTKLIYPGFSELDAPHNYTYEIPDGIQSGDILKIQYIKDKRAGNPPAPLSEQALLKKYTEGKGRVNYYPDGFIETVASLTAKHLIVRQGDNLIATDNGCTLIHYLDNFEGLLDFAGIWESTLDRIADTEHTSREEGRNLSVNVIINATEILQNCIAKRREVSGHETDITCPVCKKTFLSSKSSGVSCHGCGFKIDRIQHGRRMEDSELKSLCKKGSLPLLYGFTNDKETVYARLYLDEDYKICFTEESMYSCPVCGKGLHRNDEGYFCPSCGYNVKRVMLGHKLSGQEFTGLLTEGQTGIISNLQTSTGKIDGVLFIDRNDNCKVKCIQIEDEKNED